jgi:hypothetical protein
MTESVHLLQIEVWPIDRFVFYARNPRKNDAAVDRMCSSIGEYGFKIPVLARSDGTVVDGHLRLKSARKLRSWPGGDATGIPVILCDEWTDAQVKAFRLMVNRSVAWADWDADLLALEFSDLKDLNFDLSLTGFNDREIDELIADPDLDDRANLVPDLPESPVSKVGDVWRCGKNRVHLCRLLPGRRGVAPVWANKALSHGYRPTLRRRIRPRVAGRGRSGTPAADRQGRQRRSRGLDCGLQALLW